MKIVVIDDSADNINLIKLYCKKSSDEFSFFTDPVEAVTFLKENPVDLVFMDIQMPVINGFEALEQLRENELSKDLFVCALTAQTMDKEVDKIKKSSFNDYLQKPILRQTFLNYIDTFELKEAS